MVLAGGLGVVIGGDAALRDGAPGDRSEADGRQVQISEQRVLQDSSDWLSEAFWARKRRKRLEQRQQFGYLSPQSNPFSENGGQSRARQSTRDGGHYRTVCVRLCDGYYFPISFSTTRDQFGRDEQVCQSKCASETKLFYHPTSDQSTEVLKDRDGNLYEDLVNAYVYRTEYKPSCQCRAQPWTDEARQRHAMYATEEWQKDASRVASRKNQSEGTGKAWRIVRPGTDRAQGGEIETAAAPEAGVARAGDQPSFGVNVIRPGRSARMGLGGARRAPEQVRPKVITRRDRGWRQRVFNNID